MKSNVIAYIKSPSGAVHVVDPVKQVEVLNGDVRIVAENGTTYVTHTSNVLIIEKEVPNEEA